MDYSAVGKHLHPKCHIYCLPVNYEHNYRILVHTDGVLHGNATNEKPFGQVIKKSNIKTSHVNTVLSRIKKEGYENKSIQK